MIFHVHFDYVIWCEQCFTPVASHNFPSHGILYMLAVSVSDALQLLCLIRMTCVGIIKELSSQCYLLLTISECVDHIQVMNIKLGAHDLINVGVVLRSCCIFT